MFDFLIRIDNRTTGVDHSIAILRAGIFYFPSDCGSKIDWAACFIDTGTECKKQLDPKYISYTLNRAKTITHFLHIMIVVLEAYLPIIGLIV